MTSEVIAAEDLLNMLSKLEKLEEEKQELSDVIKDAFNEAKANEDTIM